MPTTSGGAAAPTGCRDTHFSFNTFASNNLSIDAEDYNYDGGSSFLSSTPNAFANLLGVQGIDYYETDLDGTNRAALYRPGDWPQILQVTGDAYDHAGFQAAGATDYELGYTDAGEWHNYTRSLQNTNYIVYARAASGGGGTILLERLANPSATTTDQPKAALGTLIIPTTGGSKVYSGRMIPLTDFFSNPVEIRFPGTTTFRETAVNNRAYNLNYLMFVPTTNTGTLRPYLSAGYPYPGALNVALESRISFTIANRQTAVNPASVQVFLNSNNVTGNLSFSNNAAGTVVSFAPATFLAPNVSHSLMVIYGDNDSTPVSITNFWQFTTANSPHTTLPPGDALSTVGSPPGFALRVYKVEDAAPTTASIENAETQLAGLRTNTATGQPYPNLANGGPNGDGRYSEGTVINYDITGTPTGTPAFPYKTAFPYVPPGNPNNNIAMESLMYLHLTAGDHILVVRSDDGFKLTEGPTATNRVLGLFDGGRGNGTPSLIYLTVTQDGFYPMRLLYYQAGSGGNLELYSLNDGSPILVNDPANTASIKAYQIISSPALPVTILNPAHSGNSTTFSFVTQAGRTHYVEYRDSLSSGSWTTMTTINGDGSTAPVVDNTATGDSRFYRVRTE